MCCLLTSCQNVRMGRACRSGRQRRREDCTAPLSVNKAHELRCGHWKRKCLTSISRMLQHDPKTRRSYSQRVSHQNVARTSTYLRTRKFPSTIVPSSFEKNCLYPHQLPRRCDGELYFLSSEARDCWIHELACKAHSRKCPTGYAAI